MTDKSTDTANMSPAPMPATDPAFMAQFTTLMAEAVAAAINKTQRAKVPFGAYDPRTSAHPDRTTAVKYAANRTYMQNGQVINWNVASDAEVALLNRLHRSGRYLDRMIEVVVTENGLDEEVDIRFKCKTMDDRLTVGTKVTSFLNMLEQIVAKQDELDKADEDMELDRQTRPTRRKFGEGKNTRDAYERAGA